jgi:hypothetical protein
MTAVNNVLEQALLLTRRMLAAARVQAWDELIALESERAPLLHRQHATDAVAHAQLGEVLAYDRELQALAGHARDAIAEQWQLEKGRVRAIAAYVQS